MVDMSTIAGAVALLKIELEGGPSSNIGRDAHDASSFAYGLRQLQADVTAETNGVPSTVEIDLGTETGLITSIRELIGGSPPPGDWILATGLWDDAGVWDDSANWID